MQKKTYCALDIAKFMSAFSYLYTYRAIIGYK